jgi:hypothetical protein
MQWNRIQEDTGLKKFGKRSNGYRGLDRLSDKRTSSDIGL